MAGPAADVDDARRRRAKVRAQLLVDHVSANPSAQRAVVVIDEATAQLGPRILDSISRHGSAGATGFEEGEQLGRRGPTADRHLLVLRSADDAAHPALGATRFTRAK